MLLLCVTNHSGDFVHALQVFNDLGLVRGLHAGEETRLGARRALLRHRQVVELAARVRFTESVLILTEHTDTSKKSNSLHRGNAQKLVTGYA